MTHCRGSKRISRKRPGLPLPRIGHTRSYCPAHYPIAIDTPAKTTNCRICQRFADAYEQKARRGAIQGQAGVPDHFSFSCLRLRLPLFQSRTTKTKSTIRPMAATINRPPPKQNGSKYPSIIFVTNRSPIPRPASIKGNNHRKKRMPIYQKVQ